MAKILITNPEVPGARFSDGHPMGMVYMGTALRNKGHNVLVHDAQFNSVSTMDIVKDFKPEYVGISITTNHRLQAFRLCRKIKDYEPGITTILGGSHCTNTGVSILEKHNYVDFVMKGYCEQRFECLVSDTNYSLIPGLVYRDNRETKETVYDGKPDTEDFVVPDYSLLSLEKYRLRTNGLDALPLFTSRGCSSKCVFCAAGYFSRNVAFAPVELVKENIDLILSMGCKAVRIQDDTFGMNRKKAYEIMEYLKEKGMTYSVKSRIELMDRDFLSFLAKTGCYGIKFGVESIVPHVLEKINKRLDIDKLENAISNGFDLGIQLGAYMMIGNPSESYDDAMASIQYCEALLKRDIIPLTTIGCYIFPGTLLESISREEGGLKEDFDWADDYDEPLNKMIGFDTSVPVYTSKLIGFKELATLRTELKKRVFVFDLLVQF